MVVGVINMAISTGYPVKEHKNTSSVVLDSYKADLPVKYYQHFCDFVTFTPFLQCEHADSMKPILQKMVNPLTDTC